MGNNSDLIVKIFQIGITALAYHKATCQLSNVKRSEIQA